MKSFDEWYSEAKKSNDDGFSAKDFFEAGQKSKQDEVDELQKRIDDCIKAMDESICDIDCGTIYGILTGD